MRFQSKLIPMDVAARVVNSSTPVPLLTDKPLTATGKLEKGIHIHWALPDSLTRGVTSEKHAPRFRGIPDLWLIIRFNPVGNSAKRTYRAWVLDSMTGSYKDLPSWAPPDDRDESLIHTAPGVIHRVLKGWGEWDTHQSFDPLTIAYYPACRTRLGFLDNLSDLSGASGKVSYTVIGWYSRPVYDPYFNDGFKRRDGLGHRADMRANKSLATTVSKARVQSEVNWQPQVGFAKGAAVTKTESNVLRNSAQVGAAEYKSRVSSVDSLILAIPVAPDSPEQVVVDSLMPDTIKTHTVCHGSVMDVPLKETSLIGMSTLPQDKVFLYPNIQRAMAEVATMTQQEQKVDWLEMMLGNLGQQSGTVAGVVDLPGAQHARTFQSVPGKTTSYARLDIYPPPPPPAPMFRLTDYTQDAPMVSFGHWPDLQARSAYVQFGAVSKSIPAPMLNQPPVQPAGPNDATIIAWIQKLLSDFDQARTVSAAAGKPLDARLIRVQDHRSNAQPTPQGRSIDGSGPDQAGWWIDVGESTATIDIVNNQYHAALAELRRSIQGANVHMPDSGNLFEVPGPRWYRPWSPHLVLFGARRSYRHGADGRFRLDDQLSTRVSGESMIGLKVGNATVFAKDVVTATTDLSAFGLPSVTEELVHEHVMSDAENGAIMSKIAKVPPSATGAVKRPTAAQMTSAARAIWLTRGDLLKPEQKSAIDMVTPIGSPSSAAGLQAWRDWYGPLFLDAKYTHRRKRFNDAWQLPPEHVEVIDRTPAVNPDKTTILMERQPATVTVAKVLKSNLVTEIALDPYGKPIKKKPSPNGVDAGTFDDMDIISASLSQMDDQLFAAGERERGGFVHMNQVRVFDTFGTPANWNSNNDGFTPLPQWATPLPARLCSWGRLNFRLQSAADADVEASPLTPPICGILLPDFVDQALEIYDADGTAIGQLTADDPIRGNPGPARTLSVKLTLLPWVKAALPPGSTDSDAIQNTTLRDLVQSLLEQSLDVPANASGWQETGFTAMLRVFDTVRSTLDPSVKIPDPRVRLLGEPVLVMNARLGWEASNSLVDTLKNNPELISPPPDTPALHVRVGDVTRPDDGVLGCFQIGDTPKEGRFAPISLEAADKAVLNQMIFKSGAQKTEKITHSFIQGQVSEFDLEVNTPRKTVILCDARGGLYATCGMLPRKTIILPRDFIDPSLRKLKPTFSVGPVLGFDIQGVLNPVAPPPKIEGMEASFIHDEAPAFPEIPCPPAVPAGELPAERVRIIEGWFKMFLQKAGG